MAMDKEEFKRHCDPAVPWICDPCILPSTSLNSSVNSTSDSSINSSNQESNDVLPIRVSSRGLKIGHLNVRSLYKNIDSVKLLMDSKPFDTLTVSETWLSNTILTTEITLPGYICIRKDRNTGTRGGGVAIFLREGIMFTHREDLENENECTLIEVNRPKCKPMNMRCKV